MPSLTWIIPFIFIINHINCQYAGLFMSPLSLFSDSDFNTILNSTNITQEDIFPDYLDYRAFRSQTYFNITQVNIQIMGQAIFPDNLTIDQYSSSLSGTMATFQAQMTFDFNYIDTDLFGLVYGSGTTTFTTSIINVNKTFNFSSSLQPSQCNIQFQNISQLEVMIDQPYPYLLQVSQYVFAPSNYTGNLLDAVGTYYSSQCNQYYSSQSDWPATVNFTPISNSSVVVVMNNSLSLIYLNNSGVVLGINGSFPNYPSSMNMVTSNSFIPEIANDQVFISLSLMQNITNYLNSQGLFKWTLTQDNFPLNAFDYTILDVSNVFPGVLASYDILDYCTLNVSLQSKPTININTINENLNVSMNTSILLLGPDNKTIAQINLLASANIYINLANMELSFTVQSTNFIGSDVTAQTLNSVEQEILNYYLSSGLSSLKGIQISQVSNFPILGNTIPSGILALNQNGLYIYQL